MTWGSWQNWPPGLMLRSAGAGQKPWSSTRSALPPPLMHVTVNIRLSLWQPGLQGRTRQQHKEQRLQESCETTPNEAHDGKQQRNRCSLGDKSSLALLQISMVDGALFDALEALARGIRGKQEPFGGIQLILAGQMHAFSVLYIRTTTCCCVLCLLLVTFRGVVHSCSTPLPPSVQHAM